MFFFLLVRRPPRCTCFLDLSLFCFGLWYLPYSLLWFFHFCLGYLTTSFFYWLFLGVFAVFFLCFYCFLTVFRSSYLPCLHGVLIAHYSLLLYEITGLSFLISCLLLCFLLLYLGFLGIVPFFFFLLYLGSLCFCCWLRQFCFFFNVSASTYIYPLYLHAALPLFSRKLGTPALYYMPSYSASCRSPS